MNRAMAGLANAVALKRRLRSRTLINWRMVIMKGNEHEVEEMRSMARKLEVDAFTVKTLNPTHMATEVHDMIPDSPKYRRYQYKDGTREPVWMGAPCTTVWKVPCVYASGDVTACCWDYNCETRIGNVHEMALSKLWNGPAFRELRRKTYYGKDTMAKCKTCSGTNEIPEHRWFPEHDDFSVEHRDPSLLNRLKMRAGTLRMGKMSE